ncbi:methionyl-tRNA formyltransferase [Herbaspirillum robiniae]|uniref:Methionyl-tRNA formyltransferase n=2 Tax=Herbaspirillum robiniae TaxID=2014887 RepID=A0A246WM54_9BURK|nr:methionyl-tRNA formyltransferase [Herbaspirillum robiniae]
MLLSEWRTVQRGLSSRYANEKNRRIQKTQHSIQVLTDAGSWIAPYVAELAQEWESAGHTVHIAHAVEQVRPADFCFCLSFSKIISADARKHFKHTLVVHESDLPNGRGWAPMTWQILEGKKRIPVTLIEAVDNVDAGPIYLQEWIDLDGTELNPEWRMLQAHATQRLCLQWLKAYPSIINEARQQTGEGSLYPRRRPGDSKLDPRKTLAEQFDLLRVVDNKDYPAFFEMRGRLYEIGINPKDEMKNDG